MEKDLGESNKNKELLLAVELGRAIVDSETGQRGFILAGADRFLEPYYRGRIVFSEKYALLNALLQGNQIHLEKLTQIKSLYEEWLAKAAQPEIDARVQFEKGPRSIEDLADLLSKGKGKAIIDELRSKTATLIENLESMVHHNLSISEEKAHLSNIIGLVLVLVCIIISLLLTYLLDNSITTSISSLLESTKILSTGDLTHRIDISTNDEFGHLGNAFNIMAENLHAQTTYAEAARHDVSQIMNNSPDFIFKSRIDNFQFTEVNQTACEHYNYSRDEFLQMKIFDIEANSSLKEEVRNLYDVTPAGKVLEVYGINKKKNGETFHVHVRFLKLDDVYALANVRDITERKRAEEGIREAQQQLLERQRHETELAEAKLDALRTQLVDQTRLATIGQMSASIAHEIRNPLGAVRNAAYYLKRHVPTDTPKLVQYLEIIEQEVQVANRVISDILEMSRAKEPMMASFDLARLVRDVFARMGANEAVRQHLVCRPDPFPIVADQGQLRQVIENLVLNAVQALNGNGEISVDIRRADNHDLIAVRDNGPGIDVAHRHRLFEPLFTAKAKGTGLGLTICRQIVERHGGTIDVQDPEGCGALFCVRLPRHTA